MVGPMLLWLVVAGLGVIGARRVWAGYADVPAGIRTLTAREYAAVRSAAAVIYPDGGAIAISAMGALVPSYVDRFVRAQTRRNRQLMRLLFFAVEHGTLVFPVHGPRGWRRFSSLTADQQLAYLEGWRLSEMPARRLIFTSLRAIVSMGYFAAPEVLRALGLAPRDIPRSVLDVDLLWPAVGAHPRSIPFAAADVTGPADPTPLGPEGPLHPDYR